MMSLLLVSALSITPAAYANWFHNPVTNTNLNVGSAPNPTPQNLRAIGDSHFDRTVAYESYSRIYVAPAHIHTMNTAQLTDLEGRPVFGAHGRHLGYVLAVDNGSRMFELQTPNGVGVAMPASLLSERNGRLLTPTTTHADVMAMARTQTGRTVALNTDMRHHTYRG
jgi:hypothetical protein